MEHLPKSYRIWFSYNDDPETERAYSLDAFGEQEARQKVCAAIRATGETEFKIQSVECLDN